MEEKDKIFLVGAAKGLGGNEACTDTMKRIYKSYKKYWNKKCERLYNEMAKMEDIATIGTRVALHLVILAEFRSELRSVLVRDIYHVFMTKSIKMGESDDFGNDPERVGSVLLVYKYYKYINGTESDSDREYRNLFPKIYKSVGIESLVESWLLQKSSNGNESIDEMDRPEAMARYVCDLAGLGLGAVEKKDHKIFRKLSKLLSDNRREEEYYHNMAKVMFYLANLIVKYRDLYLKVAVQPEIKRNKFERKDPIDTSKVRELEETVKRLNSRLNGIDEVYRKRMNDSAKEYMAEIARLNKNIKLLQSGKKVKGGK